MDSTRAATSPPGEIPRYEILDLIGEGALASVYKVRALKDGSIRALKALKPEQAETERAIARFEDEYRILSTLHHATLPEVYDYGVTPTGRRYMVMDYIEGVPLDTHVRENPDDLWLLLYQLNEALAFIHEHKLLHFDLKPGNVLVRRTKAFGGEEMPLAVLIDFGLSYRRETGGAVKLVGTPMYMAPEVIRGEENLTRAVDYYSLGVIIYELVEGRPPFQGNMHDILRAHLVADVTFEREKVEYAELYPWVRRLMSKEPRERLEGFQEFRRAAAARLGEATAPIERVFALGYVESLGLVGKGDAWNELAAWASRVSGGLASRAKGAHALQGQGDAVPSVSAAAAPSDVPAVGASPTTSDVLKGSATGLEERIKQDLIASAAAARRHERREEPIRGVPRVLAITGPPQSGKSTILSTLKTELRVRGVHVVSLGEGSDYASVLLRGMDDGAANRPAGVDPNSLVIDRFVAGWDELSRMGSDRGVVVMVDDLERASVEEKEFLEYIGKRLGHEIAEGKEPGIFIIAVGPSAAAKTVLLPVAGREGNLSTLEVPSPGNEDAEAIAERFRGHLSGATEERALANFLQANLQTSGALHASLKQAIADGGLVHQNGRWHFHDALVRPIQGADTTAAYYQALFRGLTGDARDLVAVLACHPSALSFNDLADISGLSETQILEAIEAVRPYRIVQVAAAGEGRRLDVISDQVREGLRLALKKPERERIHRRTIAHFAQKGEESARYFETMGYHHEELGLVREALVMRIRALAAARRAKDVFALRRLCEGGIAYVRRLKGSEWRARRWLIERFFIKQWVDAEWMVTNYRNLVRVIEDHVVTPGREIPLSFLYKYATALERTGKIPACKKVLEEGKRRLGDERTETYDLLLLEEGNVEYLAGRFQESLRLLGEVREEVLGAVSRAELYLTCTYNYETLGQQELSRDYRRRTVALCEVYDLIGTFLNVEYGRIREMLNQGVYATALPHVRRGIRLAVKHRVHRSLCSMYFIASALYYETGDYRRAMKFLDKTIRVAKAIGIPTLVYEYKLRYAFIYQKLGLYGNSIKYAESVARAAFADRSYQQHFYSLVALLELLVRVNSERASQILPLVLRTSRGVQSQNRLGLFHRAVARFYVSKNEFDHALHEYREAYRLFASTGMADEQVGAALASASVLLVQGREEEANGVIADTRSAIEAMESAGILAEKFMVDVRMNLSVDTARCDIRRQLEYGEAMRSDISDVNLCLDVDATLFEVALALGDLAKASAAFNRYYALVRHVVSNLPSRYAAEYVNNRQLTTLIDQYRSIITRNPGLH